MHDLATTPISSRHSAAAVLRPDPIPRFRFSGRYFSIACRRPVPGRSTVRQRTSRPSTEGSKVCEHSKDYRRYRPQCTSGTERATLRRAGPNTEAKHAPGLILPGGLDVCVGWLSRAQAAPHMPYFTNDHPGYGSYRAGCAIRNAVASLDAVADPSPEELNRAAMAR